MNHQAMLEARLAEISATADGDKLLQVADLAAAAALLYGELLMIGVPEVLPAFPDNFAALTQTATGRLADALGLTDEQRKQATDISRELLMLKLAAIQEARREDVAAAALAAAVKKLSGKGSPDAPN